MADCASLAVEIAALRAEIARIPRVDENRIVQTTRSALQPDISTAVAAGGVVVVNQLKPQIENAAQKASSAFLEAVDNTKRVRLAEIEARGASATATNTEKVAAEYAREMRQRLGGVEAEAVRVGRDTASRIQQIEAEIPPLKSGVNTVRGEVKNAAAKAAGAVADSAKAVKSALDTASDVTGLKGVVNGVKGSIGQLGETVVKLERSVGDALVKAAEAVGISKNALAATGKLAGQVLQIFNVIASIFTILDGMATREVLGARLDALESGLLALGRDVSKALGFIFQLFNNVKNNELNINSVRELAGEAKGLSLQATSLAQSAQISASGAQTTASVAQSTALQAQTTADGAVRNANQANENAKTAYNTALKADINAGVAQSAANESKSFAEQAKGLAGQALGKAGEALGVGLTAIALYQSVKLLRGLPGLPGKQGERGLQGIPGIAGKNGTTTAGIPGIPGRQGERGFAGIAGSPGIAGRNGINGLPGRNGINGLPGRNGIDAMPYDDSGLKAFIAGQHNTTRTSILSALGANLAAILAAISAFSNAAILAILRLMQPILGPQLFDALGKPVGLTTVVANFSATAGRFFNWAVLDRVLNLLTLATTIHNASMLSNDIGQTLLGAVSNVLSLFGIKNSEGQPFQISDIIGKSVEGLLKSVLGESNYTNLSEGWAKANRIYQATTNVLNSFLNLSQVILQASELIAAYTGKIGNALKKGGVVLESAYGWMNPQPKFNRITQGLESLQNGASTIQMVTQAPLDVANAVTESTTAATEFVKAVKEDEKPINKAVEIPEPNELKAKETQVKTASQPLNFDFSDLFDGED